MIEDYKNLERPVLLAKRTMIVEASDCRNGNVLENPGSYKIYGFYKKKHRLFEKLYPYL